MSSHHAQAQGTSRAAIGMIAVAAAAAFLATFNETFLNVALTPIMTDFGVDVSIVQWLATGYLLVAAVFVPVANVLYHRFPTRPLFVAAVAFLVVGSVVGALAPSFGVLLAGRLLQAVGTGLLTPIGMNITLAVAPREKLGLAMGIMAAMTTLGPSMAIVVSGALLSIAPWTTLMWVFGALSLLVLLAGAVLLRNVAELGRPVLDVLSFLLVAVGLVGLLYGISTAFSGSALIAAIAAVVGVLALAAFGARQNRIEHPLLNLRPFRSRSFVLGVSMTMLGLLFVFAMNVVIPIFLQSVKGQTPMGASLALAPGILMTVVLGPIAGRLFDRHGGRVTIPAGFTIMAVFALLVGAAAGHESVLLFAALYVPAVLATSLVIGPSQTFALSSLDRESSPHGVTVVSTSFQIAGCLGTSLAIGVYNALTTLGLENGSDLLGASTLGFRGAAALVAFTSVIGSHPRLRSHQGRSRGPSRPRRRGRGEQRARPRAHRRGPHEDRRLRAEHRAERARGSPDVHRARDLRRPRAASRRVVGRLPLRRRRHAVPVGRAPQLDQHLLLRDRRVRRSRGRPGGPGVPPRDAPGNPRGRHGGRERLDRRRRRRAVRQAPQEGAGGPRRERPGHRDRQPLRGEPTGHLLLPHLPRGAGPARRRDQHRRARAAARLSRRTPRR